MFWAAAAEKNCPERTQSHVGRLCRARDRIAFACFFGAFSPPVVFNTNALLFILVTAEIMRSACQIVQYRREA
jgi:hypothetical protein